MQYEQCTLEEAAEALGYLDAGCSRVDWVTIGGAVKNEFGDLGRDIFESWSMSSEKYNKSNFKSSWKSIKTTGTKRTATIATLFKLAMDQGYKPAKKEWSEQEKKQRQQEYQVRRELREKEAAIEQEQLQSLQNQISLVSQQAWASDFLSVEGDSEYLQRKQVGPMGGKFVANSFMVVVNLVELSVFTLIEHKDMVAMAAKKKQSPDDVSFTWFKKGDFVIPMFDIQGLLWSLQVIKPSATKMFIKNSRKSETCYLIGTVRPNDGEVPICLAEGFVTAASIHMATGYPVYVCWDSGNLTKIAPLVRAAFPKYPMLICGDNDQFEKETGELKAIEKNDGLSAAKKAANAARCAFVVPNFNHLMAEIKEVAHA